jgi:hypothetical protein
MSFTDNDYILYISQCANFQTRSMLIPARKFMSVPKRKNDYETLKKNSVTNYKFTIDNIDCVVDNLLIIKLIPDGESSFRVERTEYSEICSDLLSYAEGMDGYFDKDDEIWYGDALINFCQGFNHIKNYGKYKNATDINGKDVNIIDSFLVLEMRDGAIEISPYDKVDEMMRALY